jgi:hypothetical protein
MFFYVWAIGFLLFAFNLFYYGDLLEDLREDPLPAGIAAVLATVLWPLAIGYWLLGKADWTWFYQRCDRYGIAIANWGAARLQDKRHEHER